MRRVFSVGAPFGIPVRIQGLFVLFFALLGSYFLYQEGISGGSYSVFLFAFAFIFVLLHEMGHAFAARALGIEVVDITIWPLGGMARLADVPKSGRVELIVAAAGPLANLLIAGLLFAAKAAIDFGAAAYTVHLFAWMNVLLAAFNLIPAFPLDGGRVLRAVMTIWLGFDRATTWAVWIGRTLAGALAAVALYHGLVILALVAAFIFFAAGHVDTEDDEEDEEIAQETTLQPSPVSAECATALRPTAPERRP